MKASAFATAAKWAVESLAERVDQLSTGPVDARTVEEVNGKAQFAYHALRTLDESLPADGGPKMLSQDCGYMTLRQLCKLVTARILIGVGAEHLKRDAADLERAIGFLVEEEQRGDSSNGAPAET